MNMLCFFSSNRFNSIFLLKTKVIPIYDFFYRTSEQTVWTIIE